MCKNISKSKIRATCPENSDVSVSVLYSVYISQPSETDYVNFIYIYKIMYI